MASSRNRLVALCAVQFVDVMGVTVVVSALPRMLTDLHGHAAQAGLLVPVYAVGFSSLLLLSARLGDRHGHRRMLIVGLLVLAVGSVVAAAAPTMGVLVAGRAVQGAAAGLLVGGLTTSAVSWWNAINRRGGARPGSTRAQWCFR